MMSPSSLTISEHVFKELVMVAQCSTGGHCDNQGEFRYSTHRDTEKENGEAGGEEQVGG